MKSWSQRELALAVLVVFAAPAIPYVTSRLLGDLSSLFLGTVPLIGTLLSLFLYACISALVTGGRFFSGPGEAADLAGSWLWRSAGLFRLLCIDINATNNLLALVTGYHNNESTAFHLLYLRVCYSGMLFGVALAAIVAWFLRKINS